MKRERFEPKKHIYTSFLLRVTPSRIAAATEGSGGYRSFQFGRRLKVGWRRLEQTGKLTYKLFKEELTLKIEMKFTERMLIHIRNVNKSKTV